MQSYQDRKNDIDCQLAVAQDKLKQITKTLNEKTEQKDKHEMDLQLIKSKLADLNAIEYPDGNEMEMLVCIWKLQNDNFSLLICCSLHPQIQTMELDELTRIFEETMTNVVVEKGRVEDHAKLLAEKEREIEAIKKIVEEKEMQMRDLQFQHEQKHRKMNELVVNAEHSAAQIKTMEADMKQLKVNAFSGVRFDVDFIYFNFYI